MQILKVQGSIVCSSRHSGLGYSNLRLVADMAGKTQVATDTIGVKEGNWVFVISGSAARYAAGDFNILTDLTIGGIMDKWSDKDMLVIS